LERLNQYLNPLIQQIFLADSINPNFRSKRSIVRDKKKLVKGVLSGDRTLLSQTITLIESSKAEHRELGEDILEECLDHTGNSVRIGITGVPGVGKSTFIEALGKLLTGRGKKLAVLTIDPSSSRSKGSILGDKTRMTELASDPNAYIRPSPTGGALGGVARKTRESMLLCEAAGFDVIIVETVGVGQSEIAVRSMVDFFLLLMLAGAGDELQGIKRGIMEMADLIAINKADEGNKSKAIQARLEYKNALSLFPPHESGWKPPVVTCSALHKIGIDELWSEVEDYFDLVNQNNYFDANRRDQAVYWLYETIDNQLKEQFYRNAKVKKNLPELEQEVREGEISSFKAASKILEITDSSESEP
jgi:LAO/AO transport system kinase